MRKSADVLGLVLLCYNESNTAQEVVNGVVIDQVVGNVVAPLLARLDEMLTDACLRFWLQLLKSKFR